MIKKQWYIAAALLYACADSDNTVKTKSTSSVNSPIVASEAFSALSVSDFSFTFNNKQAVSIVLGSDQNNFCDVTLPRDNIKQGARSESKQRNNKNISIECNWNGEYFVRSTKHQTYANFEIAAIDLNAKMGEIRFNGQFVNVKTGKLLTINSKTVSITDAQFDNLISVF